MFFLKKLLLSRHGNERLPQEVLNVRLVYGIIGTHPCYSRGGHAAHVPIMLYWHARLQR